MPQSCIGAREPAGSESAASTPQSAPHIPHFTESQQSAPEKTASRTEWLSLDATEPFPDGLFRVPVPDAVFVEMPSLSDAALRSLLSLLHLSFRFDPESSRWAHPGDWFERSDIEQASGLSDQGTRNGLDELEEEGWADVDRTGRSHHYRLLAEVPDCRYTQVPTALLESASAIDAGTQLRIVLAVLRRTWGWTIKTRDPKTGRPRIEHDRWTQISNAALAGATGRSKTAVSTAVKALQGRWIERVRPGNGAYQYRFLPEAIGDGSGDPSSFSGDTANELAPDRQRNDPPSSSKENFPNRQPDERKSGDEDTSPRPPITRTVRNALPDDLPPRKQSAAAKLKNVGVWPERIAEVVQRFSAERIEANFRLFRQRVQDGEIHRPGAWLYRAITQGFAGYTGGAAVSDASGSPHDVPHSADELPPLEDRTRVSEAMKAAYVQRGTPESAFHLCKPGSAKPYMYFDPDGDGPTRRVDVDAR